MSKMPIVTLMRPLVLEAQIIPRLVALARKTDDLMGDVERAKSWADDILTDDHLAAGLLVREGGEPLAPEDLAHVRQTLAALNALRSAANAPGPDGGPSVGQLLRAFL